MSKNTFHIVSLGCPKNTVDADSMANLLTRAGYKAVTRPQQAQFLIVNTCGFINTARDESFKVLSHLASKKKSGQILIATGCLTQRYGIDVVRHVPGIDAILGTRRWMDIVNVVENINHSNQSSARYIISDDAAVGQDEHDVPRVSIQGPSAYLKIADGCSRLCAYCAIPLIKGPSLSRPDCFYPQRLLSICNPKGYVRWFSSLKIPLTTVMIWGQITIWPICFYKSLPLCHKSIGSGLCMPIPAVSPMN